MLRRNPSLSMGWRVVALFVLAAEAAVAAAGDGSLPQANGTRTDPSFNGAILEASFRI